VIEDQDTHEPVSEEKAAQGATEHLERIEGTLARVYRRNGYEGVSMRTPLGEVIAREEGRAPEDDPDADPIYDARSEGFRAAMRYVFADGPHPGLSMRRLYALARAIDPGLIAQMNGTDLAEMFGETRAAQSARVKMMFTGYSGKKPKLPFQKTASARERMAAAQMGNQNRRGSKIAALARNAAIAQPDG
jgi:hypothetical protein